MVWGACDIARAILLLVLIVHTLPHYQCSALPTMYSNLAETAGLAADRNLHDDYGMSYCASVPKAPSISHLNCEDSNTNEPTESLLTIVASVIYYSYKVRAFDENVGPHSSPSESPATDRHMQTGKWRSVAIAVGVVILIFVSIYFSALCWKRAQTLRQPLPRTSSGRTSTRTVANPTVVLRQTAPPTQVPNPNDPYDQGVPPYVPSDAGSTNCLTVSVDGNNTGDTDDTHASSASVARPPSYDEATAATQRGPVGNDTLSQPAVAAIPSP